MRGVEELLEERVIPTSFTTSIGSRMLLPDAEFGRDFAVKETSLKRADLLRVQLSISNF